MSAAGDTLTRFDAVSLDEMVAEAALLARVDRKYVVPQSALHDLLSQVDDRTRAVTRAMELKLL